MEIIVEISEAAYRNLLDRHLNKPLIEHSVIGKERLVNNRKIHFFYSKSYEDYLAARVLLNNDMLMQGCVLANTFVEKGLKALILANNPSFKKYYHKSSELLDSLITDDPIMEILLNRSFINFLTKIYGTRYYDTLEKDFNIYISYRKTLAELDYTAFILFNSLHFFEPNSNPNESSPNNPYKRDYFFRVENLINSNYILAGLDKSFFIEKFPDKKIEFKMLSQLGNAMIQKFRDGIQAYNDGVFDRPGIDCKIVKSSTGKYKIEKHFDRDTDFKACV